MNSPDATNNTDSPAARPLETRACVYCGREFQYQPPAKGSGRRPEYCKLPHADGNTDLCAARAKKDRNAREAAGMTVATAAYKTASEPVLTAIDALKTVLADHAASVHGMEAVALDRAQKAETEVVKANIAKDAAVTEAQSANTRARTAENERAAAIKAKQTAERLARDAEAEKEKAVTKAWSQKAAAEASAAEAKANANAKASAAAHAEKQRQEAWRRAEDAIKRNAELERDMARLQAETKAAIETAQAAQAKAEKAAEVSAGQARTWKSNASQADKRATVAETKAETVAAEAKRARAAHTDETIELQRRVDAAYAETKQARLDANNLQTRLEASTGQAAQLRAEVVAQTALVKTAESRAAAEQKRYDQLVATLRASTPDEKKGKK